MNGLYTDRTLGGDRDHCRAYGDLVALPTQDPLLGTSGFFQVQPQSVGLIWHMYTKEHRGIFNG